jgi:hypothetical protein
MHADAGSLLVDSKLITEDQLQKALSTAVKNGGTLVLNLIRLGIIYEEKLASFLSSKLKLPMVDRSQLEDLPAFIIRLVPRDIVISHRLIPIALQNGVVHVVMTDPTDRNALEEIAFATGYRASALVAPDSIVEEAMQRYYNIPPASKVPVSTQESFSTKKPEPIVAQKYSGGLVNPPPPDLSKSSGTGTGQGLFSRALIPEEKPAQEPPQEQEPEDDNKTKLEIVPSTGDELAELFYSTTKADEEKIFHLTKKKDTPSDSPTSIADALKSRTEPDEPESPNTKDTKETKDEEKIEPAEFLRALQQENSQPSATKIEEEEEKPDLPVSRATISDVVDETPVEAGFPPAENIGQALPTLAPDDSPGQLDSKQQEKASKIDKIIDKEQQVEEDLMDHIIYNPDTARELIAKATERDEIAKIFIRFALAYMPRAALFIVKKDILVGWVGGGSQITTKQVKGIMIPLSSPSVFRTVKETETDYFGSMPRTTVNDIFISAMGNQRPRQVLLIPITVRHKAVCIFYGDSGDTKGFSKDLSPVHLFMTDVSNAYERIILKKKIGRRRIQ